MAQWRQGSIRSILRPVTAVKPLEENADSISSVKRLPPANSGTPTNSLQGNISPLADRAKKHLPPPQGEISHMSLLAVGATMPTSTLAKLATTSLRPVFW